MYKRKIENTLSLWKTKANHKPLIIKGCRQCGKTSSVLDFANRNYPHVICLNFQEHKEYKAFFAGALDVDTLTLAISAGIKGAKFISGKTCLVFDEIQDCPNARSSLKFFKLDGRYDVICTGSLLGVNGYKSKDDEEDVFNSNLHSIGLTSFCHMLYATSSMKKGRMGSRELPETLFIPIEVSHLSTISVFVIVILLQEFVSLDASLQRPLCLQYTLLRFPDGLKLFVGVRPRKTLTEAGEREVLLASKGVDFKGFPVPLLELILRDVVVNVVSHFLETDKHVADFNRSARLSAYPSVFSLPSMLLAKLAQILVTNTLVGFLHGFAERLLPTLFSSHCLPSVFFDLPSTWSVTSNIFPFAFWR